MRAGSLSRAGQHFIIFVEDIDREIVIDLLHARADPPRRLAALAEPKSARNR